MKEKFIRPWTELFSDQMQVRIQKKEALEKKGLNPYKNGLHPQNKAKQLLERYGHLSKEEIGETEAYSLAGRALLVRDFGKATFIQIEDDTSKFQLYVRVNELNENDKFEFDHLDIGDIVYAKGSVFKTNKGELSLKAQEFKILTKSLRPLPEKFHGITDAELCYRMRYVDMIMNPETRDTLRKRSQIVHFIRDFFHQRDYLEVETPMMHAVAGGANARPFKTHHNSLDMELSMRIAPELFLKRLVVGGFPRVFEMNRCFRNEGISIKHNPEFTTIEFYQAYATYHDLVKLTEELFSGLAEKVVGSTEIQYGDNHISFKRPFACMTMRESVIKYSGLTRDDLENRQKMIDSILKKTSDYEKNDLKEMSVGKLIEICFEVFAEKHLIQPTFITEYPTEISPLSRRNDANPEVVDRFEFFINGWEMANAFSELNNPLDQLDRFADQGVAKEGGDDEACEVDYDFVRALEHGMPPTAGEGIGIDRLCMILTNSRSIRDVIPFPLLKKEVFFTNNEENEESKNEDA